jgi:DNA-binding LytR/AlgR family response regulator
MDIAICDDDKKICSQIENILLDYSNRNCLKIQVDVFFSGESLLSYLAQGHSYDLVYLDIEMGVINGVEVGLQVRKVIKDYATEIVYISGKDGYDRQLFDVQPLHFIPKPIQASIVIDDLKLAMERAKKSNVFYQYQKLHDIYKIPVNDIIYFESQNREMKIVTTRSEDYFYGNIEDIELKVAGHQFLRIHRSFLINYNHVAILRYTEVAMSNGVTLPISRTKRQGFRNLQINEI